MLRIENPVLKKLINYEYLQKQLNKKIEQQINPYYVFEKFKKMIQPGLDFPNSRIPFVASNKMDYKLFKDIIVDFIRLYHGVDVIKNKAEKETFTLIKSFLFILDEDIISKYFLEIDLTSHRNINEFDFPSSISVSKRQELKEILKTKIEEIEPNVFQRIKNLKLSNNENEKDDYIVKGIFFLFL